MQLDEVMVDAPARFLSKLHGTTGLSTGWQAKVVLFILKTLTVNGFVAWRMLKCTPQVHESQSCGSVDNYRDALGRSLSFSDWI